VKNISVNKNKFDGRETPLVTITYRFTEPENICSIPTVEEDYTPEREILEYGRLEITRKWKKKE